MNLLADTYVAFWMRENSIEFLRSPLSTIPLTTDISPKFALPSVCPSSPSCYLTLLSSSLNYQLHLLLHLLRGQGHKWEPRPSQVSSWPWEFQSILKATFVGKVKIVLAQRSSDRQQAFLEGEEFVGYNWMYPVPGCIPFLIWLGWRGPWGLEAATLKQNGTTRELQTSA